MDSWLGWRKMPKVCKGRSGAANGRVYPASCMWCDRPATKLCDTMLRGRFPNGDLDLFQIDGPTCDADICDEHSESCAVHSLNDSIDACPYCQMTARGGARDCMSAKLWRERVAAHAAKTR